MRRGGILGLALVGLLACGLGAARGANADDLTAAKNVTPAKTALESEALGAPPAGSVGDAVGADGLPSAQGLALAPDEPPAPEPGEGPPVIDAGDPPAPAPPLPEADADADADADSAPAPESDYVDVREIVPPSAPEPCAPICRTRELCCGQVYDDCLWPLDECGRRYGRWKLSLEGGIGLAEDPEGLVGPATGLANQITWDALSYDLAFGGRAGLQYALGARDRVLFRGAYYGSWDDRGVQNGVIGFSMVPGGPILATVVNTATLRSEAELYGGELHWWHEVCSSQCVRWDVGVGLRALILDEEARIDKFEALVPGGMPAFVQSEAENTFLGAQVGGAVYYDHDRRWTLFASVKGLAGSINRDLDVTDDSFFIGGRHSAGSEESEFAWGVDAEVGLQWRLNRNVIFGASYNLLFLDNVVHATDAMDFTQGATGAVQARQRTDDMLVHAFWAGLTFNF